VIVATIEILQARVLPLLRRRWWWRMRGHNGEILATSELYTTRDKARQTAEKIRIQLLLGSVEPLELDEIKPLA
jgi:hypothetical protein